MNKRKIASLVVGFVGSFAIGALGMLVLLSRQAFDNEPDYVRDATDLDWVEELPF